MTRIKTIETGHYRIPLPVTLSYSTHGEITAFELLTVRLQGFRRPAPRAWVYTYTVGRNGGAIADILRRDIPGLIEGAEADDTEAIWHRIWWALHYGGRGGPTVLALSAVDIALWDLSGAPRQVAAAGVCSAASMAVCPATPAASISIFRSRPCYSRPTTIFARAFVPSR